MVGKKPLALFVFLLLFACGGERKNPILPTDPVIPPADQVTVTVASDVSQVNAGSAATTLRISAKRADNTPPADGTEVTINTSLGSFATGSDGAPVRLTKATLAGGAAQIQFFPGSETGVANILAQVGTSVGRLNLTIAPAPPAPVADFTFTANGLNVLFADASTGSPTSRRWQFGDGGESSETSPAHAYAAPGTYAVTLTVANGGGQSSKSQFVTVSLGNPPTSAFDFEVAGQQVNFVDRSTGATTWSWSFGDGMTSTQRNPVHTYASPGTYTVDLTVTNAAGSNVSSKVVKLTPGAPPAAAFDFQVSGFQVNFVDRSTNAPSTWSWSFGDGGSSTEQNPIHTYAQPGNYTVILRVTNASGANQTSNIVAISPGTPPEAAFSFTIAGSQVNFLDKSKGSPTAWAWSFGDGGTSTAQNPIHTYERSGNYTVTLTISNAGGSSSTSSVVAITPATPPVADFEFAVAGLQVNFVDRSTGGAPASWQWTFGDGSSSRERNPVHTYEAAGQYTVTLRVTNSGGSSTKSMIVTTQ